MPREIKSYSHRGGETPLLGLTIAEHFSSIAHKHPDSEAVVSVPQGRRLTYGELSQAIDLLGRGLLGMGFGKGDRIGIWSTNNIEWIIIQMATARIGAVLVNINPAYRPRELAYALEHSEINGIFTIPAFRSNNYIEMLRHIIPELEQPATGDISSKAFPHLRHVVIYDPSAPHQTTRPAPGFTLWQEVMEAAGKTGSQELQDATDSLDMDETINIQYTSGTTGFPKAVMLTHHNILNNAYFSARAMRFTQADRLCVSVPFYHCFGMVLANLLCLGSGACIVIACEHFDALETLKAIESEQCSALHGVPTMFIAALEHESFEDFDLSSLRTGIMAGAPCPFTLMRRVIGQMHLKEILIGYGETEASPLTHLTSSDDTEERRTGTVGTNMPHQEVKIIDVQTGRILPTGTQGELCFRGYNLMKGYYKDPEATQKAIDPEGWLHSGDLGIMDKDGYVKITGRLKEMIIRGGENIFPREIEDFLFTHPKVAVAAVFGIPDDYYGEEIMAWITLHQGETATEQEIRDYCKGNIAHFKIPRYIRFVKEFPMTVTGKLQKFKMREIALKQLDSSNPPEIKQ